jgi:hypothetical protein
MKIDGGKSILTLAGEPILQGDKIVQVGPTLAGVLVSVINEEAETKLTTIQCYELAKKLASAQVIDITQAERDLCVALANQLPIKLSYHCLMAMEE